MYIKKDNDTFNINKSFILISHYLLLSFSSFNINTNNYKTVKIKFCAAHQPTQEASFEELFASMVATAHAPLQEPTRMKESRTKKPSEGGSEISAWLSKSRKLEKKRASQQLSKIFEEQDKIAVCESDDKDTTQHTENLALHGFDETMEGGSVVVLTIKDQPIIAEGDVNEEVDMLENVEIGEQKRRDEAYKATKKKTGACDDEFNDEEKKMLAQCDDVKVSSDYYTHEEMLKFKKPRKKNPYGRKMSWTLMPLKLKLCLQGWVLVTLVLGTM